MFLKLGFHYGLTWDNIRSFLWDILLTQVNPNGNIFQRVIKHILSNLSQEITWLEIKTCWCQDNEIILSKKCSKVWLNLWLLS